MGFVVVPRQLAGMSPVCKDIKEAEYLAQHLIEEGFSAYEIMVFEVSKKYKVRIGIEIEEEN